MVTGVRTGLSPQAAASRSVQRTQFALLGATVIGLLAFAPIGLSADKSGHFLRSLFQVVAISLLLSWVLAVTVVPLLGSYLLKAGKSADGDALYSGWGYAPYLALIRLGLRRCWSASLIIVAITGACLWGFGYVKQGFFPMTDSPLFFIDYYLPQGTDIRATADEVASLERVLQQDQSVVDVTSFIGRGPARFMATMRPEQPNPAYAHLLVRVADVTEMDQVMARSREKLAAVALDAELQIRRSQFTSSGPSKIEARFYGSDPDVLRRLSDKALDIYLAHDLIDLKTDWRQRELQIVPRFDEERARVAGVGRSDVYRSLAFATYGVRIGLFRDADKLIPIIARAPHDERVDVRGLSDRMVWSSTQHSHIPMSQVVSAFELQPEDNTIYRRDRTRTISALANPPPGHNVIRVFNQVRPDVEAIALPPGYRLEWGGEYEASQDAQRMLLLKVPLTFGIMFLITVLMFGRMRQPIVIWLTVPMIVCGVVISLLVTDMSFTFPAFLGFLSLSGMLIKNCIVLVDEIDKRLAEGAKTLDVIAAASVSRLRPVMLAAGTTIAGMSPLLADPFFAEMAVCIMGGLAFATLLTLVAVPVFYRIAMGRMLTAGEPVVAEAAGVDAQAGPEAAPG
jgi:multidrug efflux pump subunit AcrB